MPSILTTPPALEPVSLSEAKAHLRVGHGDEDDLIGKLIVAARRHLEQQTGLAFITQGWSCFRDSWPDENAVMLPVAPVQAISDVKVYGEDDNASTIDPAHYFLDNVSRPPRLMLRGSRIWPAPGRSGNGIEIRVTAGFGSAASDVPQPLREAMLLLVAHWYAHRGDGEARGPLGLEALIDAFREKRL